MEMNLQWPLTAVVDTTVYSSLSWLLQLNHGFAKGTWLQSFYMVKCPNMDLNSRQTSLRFSLLHRALFIDF